VSNELGGEAAAISHWEEAEPEHAPGRIAEPPQPPPRESRPPKAKATAATLVRVFPYGIARTRLERAIREKNAPVIVANDINEADAVIAIRSTYQNRPAKLREINRPITTVVVKSNTFSQISSALEELLRKSHDPHEHSGALEDVKRAIEQVSATGKPAEVRAQTARLRKAQHQLVELRKLRGEFVGQEPNRRLRIFPASHP